jgi:hypothetical protein
MGFTIATFAGLLLVALFLTYFRFKAWAAADGRRQHFSFADYWSWLRRGTSKAFARKSLKNAQDILSDWAASRYPGWTKYVFAVFSLSFIYQAASGFFFAVFVRRGMFGLPLLIHMVSGSFFAVSLTAVAFWRAGEHRPGGKETGQSAGDPVIERSSARTLPSILFWTFAAFGFIQVTTALGSMVSFFAYETQKGFIEIHRSSGLCCLLTAIIFVDTALIPKRRS